MYFKLSIKNLQKSFKDYALYFLTLTFGVCIFYVFNSIEAQKAMLGISQSVSLMMQTLTKLMGVLSVFVSFILGFLIVYANNFLIRRRKKEFGIYMTVGMEKGTVAKILVIENFLMGILSLGIGLLIGIFISQGLSVVTAKLFEIDMTMYHFVFSPAAFLKTIIYFSVIFLIVMAMSTISISRYKLIDLINAERKNEQQRIRKPVVTVILFLFSIACLGTAYGLVMKNGIFTFDKRLLYEILLGSIGTFLFFASLAGFFLKLIQTNKRKYHKGLNAFILRQIDARINTAHFSMSFICLMLFCTIGILSTGLGMNGAIKQSYKNSSPFDVSFMHNSSKEDIIIGEELKQAKIDINNYTDRVKEYSLYIIPEEKLTNNDILDKVRQYLPEKAKNYRMSEAIHFIKLSDYNELMDMRGKEKITLLPGEVGLYSSYAESTPELKTVLLKFIELGNKVDIRGKQYNTYSKLLTDGILTSPVSEMLIGIIVEDNMLSEAKSVYNYMVFNCKDDRKANQIKLENDITAFTEKNKNAIEELKITLMTRETIKVMEIGVKAIISFVGIYLGIVFLITSSAILALQQLSEATDNRHRYNILQKVGADDKLVKKTLLKQVAIYFMLPLALACVHSVIGIKVANDAIRELGRINVLGNIIVTAIMITVIYGSYFLATYFSCKRIIISNKL